MRACQRKLVSNRRYDQRGHGLGVSMEVYTIFDHQQKRKAVKQLESMIGRPCKTRKSA